MYDLLTIDEAARHCKIHFLHSWWMVTTNRWTPVRTGPGARCIRVRRSEVEATKARWDAEDEKARDEFRARAKAEREARKNVARIAT